MEIVVLNSDIARLVLDYLKSQKLKKAIHCFCKTSPYLKQEFSAYKQGLQTHSFFPELEEIICEYVKIWRKVEQIYPKLQGALRSQLQHCKLSEKVIELLERASHTISIDNVIQDENDLQNNDSAVAASQKNNDRENNPAKRKRNCEISPNSSNDEQEAEDDGNKHQKITSRFGHYSKKRRILQPYCFLSPKALQRQKCRYVTKESATTDEDLQEENEDETQSSIEDGDYPAEIFEGEKPRKESTPRLKSKEKGKLMTPIPPDISQAILGNPEIKNLIENINQVLNKSGQKLIVQNLSSVAGDTITPDVVEASNKMQVPSAAIQCNINNTNLPLIGSAPIYSAMELLPLEPLNSVTQLQQYPTAETVASSTHNIISAPTTNVLPPRTPIILRSASGASTAETNGPSCSAQDPPSILANNSFGPLVDPNFSISKLIVLNSNDSSQKVLPENCISNTSADSLINQLSTSVVADGNNDQVYFDTSTGQLTFPIFLTSDGLSANFPFLINNELVTQQLQNNNIGNLEGSRLEIPLNEPIIINANQLPPNSIILSSAQKEIVAENSDTAGKTKFIEIKHCNAMAPASVGNKFLCEKATPSCSGILNTKKSFSTPRKRTSHVRTLTFSPLNNADTPTSTRRKSIYHPHGSLLKVEENKEVTDNETKIKIKNNSNSDKVVIKAIEILPTIAKATIETITDSTNISTNDTNVPPLFVSEESSNQTIINKHISGTTRIWDKSLKPKSLTDVESQDSDTPKRKQLRKAAVRSCRRQLSKCSNEKGLLEEKQEKANEETMELVEKSDAKPSKSDMMKEWVELRTCKVDLDVRLRELNAAELTHSKQGKKVNTKKKFRRKKPAAIKKKEKDFVKKAEELEKFKEQNEKNEPNMKLSLEECDNQYTTKDNVNISTSKRADYPKEGNSILQEEKLKEAVVESHAESNTTNVNIDIGLCEVPSSNQFLPPHVNEAIEGEKRTTNIAFLLETPFKDPNLTSCYPPTPGIFAPSLETPASKLKDSQAEMQASASFLFGSISKSDLDTPLTCAVTPGYRIAGFGLKDFATPKSIPGTDYSSGGSYYKPDESDDLDRNIDKMLRNSAQKQTEPKTTFEADCVEQNKNDAVEEADVEREEGEIEDEQDEKTNHEENEIDEIEIEIPVEKLRVEPIVLKRVKSFNNEIVDCVETTKIDPHYTLVSGLPEISTAEECLSSSSSSDSSSTSHSSSSSSSSSESSSSSSSSSNTSVKSKTELEKEQSNKINELENLSEISSTEDEEWQKLEVNENSENSRLVNNDGEVRYPVRSWLTPLKENIAIEPKTIIQSELSPTTTSAKMETIKVTLPLKSAEKRNRQVRELELKKERMKQKLKNDAGTLIKKDKPTTSTSAASNISAALATSRILHAMRDKGKKIACHQPLPHRTESKATETPMPEQEKRSLDVLTALNLSAKKHLPKTPENAEKPVAASKLKNSSKTKINISPRIINKSPQRKCLPIEARPVTRTIRKSGKKIVRTPLAFKIIHSPGKINSHSTTTTLAEFAATKTLNKSKETSSSANQKVLRVSPRLMKLSKPRSKTLPDSSIPKSKISTLNAKNTSTIAKEKATSSRSQKKESVKVSSKKETKKINNKSLKEESLENVNTKKIPETSKPNITSVIKPKIHLKARNALISLKTKKAKKDGTGEALKIETEKVSEILRLDEKKELEHQPVEPTINTTPVTPQANIYFDDGNNNDDNDDDDDDPLADCEMTTIEETDAKRFINYIYNGPDGPPTVVPENHNLSNFQLVVAIDENEKHIWRITEGICLFSNTPNLSRFVTIVTKKHNIRTTSVTNIKNENPPAPTKTISPVKDFSSDMPSSTSTPIAIQISSNRTFAENLKAGDLIEEKRSKDIAVATKQKSAGSGKKCLPESSNETPKIQIEDIDAILSHLHGT